MSGRGLSDGVYVVSLRCVAVGAVAALLAGSFLMATSVRAAPLYDNGPPIPSRETGRIGLPSTSLNAFDRREPWDVPILWSPGPDNGIGRWAIRGSRAVDNRAFSLHGEVVPEPGTGLLLSAGLAGLAARRSGVADSGTRSRR